MNRHPLAQSPDVTRRQEVREINYQRRVSPSVQNAKNGLRSQLEQGAKRRLTY